jgi:hypothetical protein
VPQARVGLREKEVNKNFVGRGKQHMAEMMMMMMIMMMMMMRARMNEGEEEDKLNV